MMRRFEKTASDYEAMMVEEVEAEGCKTALQNGDLIAIIPYVDPDSEIAKVEINLSLLAQELERQLS
ncbi:MAG: hypothetical protein ACOH2J_18270 [Allorhizobium sp.]